MSEQGFLGEVLGTVIYWPGPWRSQALTRGLTVPQTAMDRELSAHSPSCV